MESRREYDAWKQGDLSHLEVLYGWANGLHVKSGVEDRKAAPRRVGAALPENRSQSGGHLKPISTPIDRCSVNWRDLKRRRAVLSKGDEELRANKDANGTWSHASRSNPQARGDIVDFEARRGARTAAIAREALRPELQRIEREQGQLDRQEQQERSQRRNGPERNGADRPERDPNR